LKGADINHKNEHGISALEYAQDLGIEQVINSLLEDLSSLKKNMKQDYRLS